MPYFRISQVTTKSIVIEAANLEEAEQYEEEMGDDDFNDEDWGEITIEEVPNPVVDDKDPQ